MKDRYSFTVGEDDFTLGLFPSLHEDYRYRQDGPRRFQESLCSNHAGNRKPQIIKIGKHKILRVTIE